MPTTNFDDENWKEAETEEGKTKCKILLSRQLLKESSPLKDIDITELFPKLRSLCCFKKKERRVYDDVDCNKNVCIKTYIKNNEFLMSRLLALEWMSINLDGLLNDKGKYKYEGSEIHEDFEQEVR